MGPRTKRFMVDLVKVGFLLFVVGYALVAYDPTNEVVVQAVGFGLFFVGGTHLTRRILFDKLDLQAIAMRAVEERNMPAAVVFLTVMVFLMAVMALPLAIIK